MNGNKKMMPNWVRFCELCEH